MVNFHKYASPLVTNTSWDPGNKYTMAWQSGWTAIGYNSSIIKDPGTSVDILFDRRYSGKVGMMADPQELGSLGLLAIGVSLPPPPSPTGRRRPRSCRRRRATGSSAPTTTRTTSTT